MGTKLMVLYKYVYDEEGLTGKVKLAQVTKVPSTEAAIILDTPEKIKIFKDAIEKITGKPIPSEILTS